MAIYERFSNTSQLQWSPLPNEGQILCDCCKFHMSYATIQDRPYCMACLPSFALDQPNIDNIACLIWLNEIDQGILNRLTTLLHASCAARHETVYSTSLTGHQQQARIIFMNLLSLRMKTKEHFGTFKISKLREIFLSERKNKFSTKKNTINNNLRTLYLGRWFEPNINKFDNDFKSFWKMDNYK